MKPAFSKSLLAALVLSGNISVQMATAQQSVNPLLQKSTLQYQAPPFDLIKDEHFKPAFDIALQLHDAEIEKIANNKSVPTFENTVLALEISGEDLNRATGVFYNLKSANNNDVLQKIDETYAPVFSSHFDKIYLNSKIYNRIKALNINNLKGEDKRLAEYYLQKFELEGSNLSDDDKTKMKKINEELATLSTSFSSKLLKARKKAALVIDDVNALEGLSPEEIAIAKSKAKELGYEGKYVLAIQNTTQQPLLAVLKNRTTREKLFTNSWNRAEKSDSGDTREIIEKMAGLRLQKANLMGKKTFAEWSLQDKMAKTPGKAMDLLARIATSAIVKVKTDAKEIQDIIDSQKGGFKLQPWDWDFYAEQVRKAKYNLDVTEIKPYFELRTVLEKGVFFAAQQMYGISFKQRTDLPVYHPDVVVYEIFDSEGKSIAIYYLDFYTRDNKRGGAWMNNFVDQSHFLKQKPVIVNVFNYTKPTGINPSLISFDDVRTMFHEFGHTLHGLFANQKYTSLSGTSVPRDFVEFPSQINEHCALDTTILKNYAIHYQTKQRIPNELIDKIKKSENFNGAYRITELLEASTIDMAWHNIESTAAIKPTLQFEKEVLEKYNMSLSEVPPRYHSPYFAHIWGGGYSAGYYAYTWSKTLDFNAYDWFKANGGMNKANGERFRKYILSVGNSVDLDKAFQEFVGHEMQIEPYLRNTGLLE